MRQALVFKEWLPDQADMGGEGLIVAKNVLPIENGYSAFLPLDTSLATVPAKVDTAIFASFDGNGYVYAHEALTHVIYKSTNGATSFNSVGTTPGFVSFAQFDDLMIMASDQTAPVFHTLGSSSTVAALSASTLVSAKCIGVVNRFVVLGNLVDSGTNRTNTIRWSGIDNPQSWPTPNSATAIAQQSGEQDLDSVYGNVIAIHGGDQRAIILQRNAVIRMTYVGPPVVFQFDIIDNTKGLCYERGSINVGNLVYFISDVGICRTDGVSVQQIGHGKVDKYLWSTAGNVATTVPNCGHDPSTGLVYFAYSTVQGTFDCDRVIIYNPATDTFAYANQNVEMLLTPTPRDAASRPVMLGFGTQSNSILGKFQATAGSAVLETSEFELNPGGRSFVSGVKPNVESTGTAPAIAVRVGYRDDLGTTPSYTSTTNATASTGFADFRIDSKYARSEINITGNFDKTTGFVVDYDISSDR